MLVAESMPPTSEQLPLLGIYYAVTIGIVSMSTAFAVLTLNINNKGNRGKNTCLLFLISGSTVSKSFVTKLRIIFTFFYLHIFISCEFFCSFIDKLLG